MDPYNRMPGTFNQDNVVLYYDFQTDFLGSKRAYIDWSLVVCAPVCNFLEETEFYDYLVNTYGWHDRAYWGTTKFELMFDNLVGPFGMQYLKNNKAGPNGIKLTTFKLINSYAGPGDVVQLSSFIDGYVERHG